MDDVHVFIVGADQVCYGGPTQAPNGKTWGTWAKEIILVLTLLERTG